ncbi:TonB-dependent receptor plug domain-containing protein [Novosphingobium sp. 9U]|uniref:TonB-dependent receptor plug domain-containing protein n=1 Tax=Novosphingobium sp. 9U TaxID=2653158 RepID=UPI0012F2CC89|nr:TonB-dependent receptor plug domain-containing protein [Novosphingobium sp. 9U]VWX50268.1 hypothetical protein NOVOSPHI9U_260263 [Novosphingobium sp. 9U]
MWLAPRISQRGLRTRVAFYVDGVYIKAPYAGLLGLNNADRIEVLRGSQGVSFGRNATGGLIRIVTKDPAYEPSIDVDISLRSFGAFSTSVYATGGLTSKVAISITALSSVQQNGYGTNLLTGRDIEKTTERAVRAELR